MAWTIERSAEADLDLALIFDFLLASARDFGEPTVRAFEQASRRVKAIGDAIFVLSNAPHQGTLDHGLLPALRRMIKERAIIYFDAVRRPGSPSADADQTAGRLISAALSASVSPVPRPSTT